jgi:hypothetical protein
LILPGTIVSHIYKQLLTHSCLVRLLHARIHLFRPMLARLCLSQSQLAVTSSLDQGLGDRILQDCASICVDTAQKMVALIYEHHQAEVSIGVIPWWHRMLYLHVAGTILIAAMLRADLYTPMVSQSWTKLMSALRAHEHLSPFVQQCKPYFVLKLLSARSWEHGICVRNPWFYYFGS